MSRQDVAEIARGYGEVDRIAFATRDGEVAFEVIDDLCGDPRPVDRIDGADCVTRLEFGVGADRLDDVLAFVEHALDREIVDVRIGERVHLRRLERAHPALRRQHEDRNSALAAHRVLGGTPRVAGGGAKNVEPAPALDEHVVKQIAEKLQGDVFECERRSVRRMQQMDAGLERGDRRDVVAAENRLRVGPVDDRLEIGSRYVADEARQHREREITIVRMP